MNRVESLQGQLEAAIKRTVEATAQEVQTAVLVLAAEAHDLFPTATRIYLSLSDQGDWLTVNGLLGSGDEPTCGFRGWSSWDTIAASSLYLEHLTAIDYLHQDNLSGPHPFGSGQWYIDITAALEGK
jgi:hypothetical protein